MRGDWITVSPQVGGAQSGAGRDRLSTFTHADLHLVLGPDMGKNPVRFRVTIDGAPPGAAHGADTNARGEGVVTEQRLYQLVRQNGVVADRTFEIEFLDPGVQAYSFTFG